MIVANMASEVSMTCGTTCSVCHTDNVCHDTRNMLLLDLDLEASGQTLTDASTNFYKFTLGSSTASSTDDPTRIPN